MVQCCSITLPTRITCPDTHKLCGNKFCYDPATQFCSETGSVLTCINACGQECYDSATHVCLNNTLCSIGQNLCEVKYGSSGNPIEPQKLCYDPRYKQCLNHTLCYEKDRVCNGQCILYTSPYQYLHQICAIDNKTLCNIQQPYNNYKPNQIQVCNGSCYDTQMGLKRCVNGFVQCVSNCDNVCYNTMTHVCVNGALCSIGSELCESGFGRRCYNPLYEKCLNGTVCSNDRICGGQCISNNYQVCANDKRTVCNVMSYYGNYRPYQMHICDGNCFDTSIQQCINGVVSCINTCGQECYDSATHVCLNNTLCLVGQDLCGVKYDGYFGNLIEPVQLQCYDLQFKRCLNHTLCYEKDRVCNGQCILYTSLYQYQVCANDNKTLCNVSQHYNYYKPNQIQICNGSCYDTEMGLKRCVNDSVQCVSKCSNLCYNAMTHVCVNGTVCYIGSELCESGSRRQCYNPLNSKCLNGTVCSIEYNLCESGSGRQCYDPLYSKCLNGNVCSIGYNLCESGSTRQCYDPLYNKCLNGTVCSNDRACGGQCISNNYQVCANDKRTVCNVTRPYDNYRPNQIQLCLGVCYDSSVQQCSGEHVVVMHS